MSKPLAERMRPASIEEMVGQSHLIAAGKPLRNIILSGDLPNLVFYGPPGIGKTTLASIIAAKTDRHLVKLNGTTASTADIKAVAAKIDTFLAPNGILLYLDEIQYFNKKQQQTLLEFIENGSITLIASTTENPYFYIYGALLSRCTVFEFKPLSPADLLPAVERAFLFLKEDSKEDFVIEEGLPQYISQASGGDVRKALNSVELCVLSAPFDDEGRRLINLENAKMLTQRSAMRYDKGGDEHYDIISAFQKSMRGSDPDAALHYLARLLEADDLPSACRRLMVCACEDVGLAYPQIIPIVKAAVDAAMMLGLPEARIPLADAVVLVATSPKSNSAYLAIDAALADIKNGKSGPVPRQLQNKHFDGEDAAVKGQFYDYPHSHENHWVKQQYLPDALRNSRYYEYGDNKMEQTAKEYWDRIKKTQK